MKNFKSHLYSLAAYTPPLEGRDPDQYTLLDFNERTLPVGDMVSQALVDYIQSGRLQVYPHYGDITGRLADYCDVKPEQVMITNGSDQGIELIFRASCGPGDEVIIPSPNFAMYSQCAKIEGASIVAPPYSREHGFPEAEVLAAISEKTRIVCIASPNNPSGVGVSRKAIKNIAEAAPNASILVDECYFEYSRTTVADLIDELPNVLITRTFSKTWGIPSLRFGYLLAHEDNIRALLSVRGPYDINQLAVVAARAALDHPEYTREYVAEVMEKAKPLLEAFLDRQGIVYWPSCANYLWMFPREPEQIEQGLRAQGILVRPKADNAGQMGLRVTVGSVAQTEVLIDVLERLLVRG